jgi:hypothetical protein
VLYDIANLRKLTIAATDGEIGSVEDVYFDDESWTARYLVVDTGSRLAGRKVLISPIAVLGISWADRTLGVELTRAQIEAAPDIDTDKPVSRHFEAAYLRYFGYPYYWTGPYLWGATPHPAPAPPPEYELAAAQQAIAAEHEREEARYHLRSAREMNGYHIVAPDGGLGHVETFLVHPESWSLRALVVDTRNWLPGKRVLVPPQWVDRIAWSERAVYVNVSRDAISASPAYEDDAPVTDEQVERLLGSHR